MIEVSLMVIFSLISKLDQRIFESPEQSQEVEEESEPQAQNNLPEVSDENLNIISPIGMNNLIRSVSPNRSNYQHSLIPNQNRISNQYTSFHTLSESVEEEFDEDASGSSIRFERIISVSIDAPNIGLLSIEQIGMLENIFDIAFDFENFMRNFLENFPRMEQLLERELGNLSIQDRDLNRSPSQRAIENLPNVEINRGH